MADRKPSLSIAGKRKPRQRKSDAEHLAELKAAVARAGSKHEAAQGRLKAFVVALEERADAMKAVARGASESEDK